MVISDLWKNRGCHGKCRTLGEDLILGDYETTASPH